MQCFFHSIPIIERQHYHCASFLPSNDHVSAIIDNTDGETPVRRFADYCSVKPAPLGATSG